MDSSSQRGAGVVWLWIAVLFALIPVVVLLTRPFASNADMLSEAAASLMPSLLCLMVGAYRFSQARNLQRQERATAPLPSPERYPVGTIIVELSEAGAEVQRGRIIRYDTEKAYVEMEDGSEWWFDRWNERFVPEDLLN